MSVSIGVCRSPTVRPAPLHRGSVAPWAGLPAVLGAALVVSGAWAADEGAGAAPPPAVTTAAVVVKDVEREGHFVGNVQAIQSVDLKARVEGYLAQVAFTEGSTVTSGQLLYQIEQAPFQADLLGAQGQAAAAQAQLDAANAELLDKQADYDRFAVLVKQGDTSKANFDKAKADRDSAAAAVEQAKAEQQQAAAAEATAQINLGYTSIQSPITGRIGATAVTAGNLVGPNTGTLANVAQQDPIRVVFSVPSAAWVRYQERVHSGGADPNAPLTVEVVLPTGAPYAHPGTVSFANNQVNVATGTVAIYADFPNPEGLLLPGQYVTAVVRGAAPERLPTVPAAALLRTRDGDQVYVIGDGNRVEARKVQTGPAVGTEQSIASGLTAGEIVIVSGIQKVRPGMVVAPTPAEQQGRNN